MKRNKRRNQVIAWILTVALMVTNIPLSVLASQPNGGFFSMENSAGIQSTEETEPDKPENKVPDTPENGESDETPDTSEDKTPEDEDSDEESDEKSDTSEDKKPDTSEDEEPEDEEPGEVPRFPLMVYNSAPKAETGYTYSNYTFTSEKLPEGFYSIQVKVGSLEDGYTTKRKAPVAFAYTVCMDDDVLYERSEEMMNEPSCPRENKFDNHFEWLTAVKEWLKDSSISSKYPSRVFTQPLGEYFSNYSTMEDVKLTFAFDEDPDPFVVGTCKIENGALEVELDPICDFMSNIYFDFNFEAVLDGTGLNDEPQQVVFDDKGQLVLKAIGEAGGGDQQPEAPHYTVKKTAPVKVKGTTIDYTIEVEATDDKNLLGKTLKDFVPNGLEIQAMKVQLEKDGEEIEIEKENLTGSYTFSTEATYAKFQISMGLTPTEYQNFINFGINRNFANRAILYEKNEKDILAESETVSTNMNATFLNKVGKADNLEGTKFLWTITLNTQLPTLDYGYLVDTLIWTDHKYDLIKGIDIQVDGTKESFHVEKIIDITAQVQDKALKWEDILEEKSAEQVQTDIVNDKEFQQKAYYYLIDTEEDNPFYTEGSTTETPKKQRAILLLPFKNLHGSTESKKVTIKYATDLNFHDYEKDHEQYWQMVATNPPTIDNMATLIWVNTKGDGPTPPPPEAVNIEKNPQTYPGSVTKKAVKYDQKTQNLTWEIDVNKIGIAMDNAVLTDTLTDNYDLSDFQIEWYRFHIDTQELDDSGTLNLNKVKSETEQAPSATLTNDGFKVEFGNIPVDTFYTLRFTLKLQDGKILSQQNPTQKATNKAKITYGGDTPPKEDTAECEKDIPNTLIEKSAVGSYDYATGELKWKIKVNPNHIPIQNASVKDILPKDFEFGKVTEVTATDKDNKPVDKPTLGLQVDTDTKDHTFILTSDSKETDYTYNIEFTTKATSEWIQENLAKANDTTKGEPTVSVDVKNTAELHGTIYGTEVNASASATNTVKRPLMQKGGTYNSDDKTINWKIVLNKEQQNIAGYTFVETLTEEGQVPTHELDLDSVKIERVTYLNGTATSEEVNDFELTTATINGFSYVFPSIDGDKNCAEYRISFTTELTGNPKAPTIENRVYLKDENGNNDNVSNPSDGGYHGEYNSSSNSGAAVRPQILVKKISSNTESIPDKDKFALDNVQFTLAAHEFEIKDNVLTIGNEAEPYQKNNMTEDGEIFFNNIKTSKKNENQEVSLISVLTETKTADGYVLDDTPYFVYFPKGENDNNLTALSTVEKITYTLTDKTEKTLDLNENNEEHYKVAEVDKDGKPSNRVQVSIKNTPKGGSLTFTKKEVKLDSYQYDMSVENNGKLELQIAKGVKFKIIPKKELEDAVNSDTKTTNENGEVIINGLDPGTYTLQEIKANTGQAAGEIDFEVIAGESANTYRFKAETGKNIILVESGDTTELQDDLKYVNVSFTKKVGYQDGTGNQVVAGNEEPLQGAKFRLESVEPSKDKDGKTLGVGAGNIKMIATSGSDGKVTFANLPIGNYEIYETYENPVTGYKPQGWAANKEENVYTLAITDPGTGKDLQWTLTTVRTDNTTVKKDVGITQTGNKTGGIIYNKPIKGTLTFKKQVSEADLVAFNEKPLAGAVYGLFRVINGASVSNKLENNAVYTATSGADGSVTFPSVEYGDYILKEVSSPVGYQLSETEIEISKSNLEVSGDGDSFTFDKSSDKDYLLTNTIWKEGAANFTKQDADKTAMPNIDFYVYRRGAGKVDEVGKVGDKLMEFAVEDSVKTYYSYGPKTTVRTGNNGELSISDLPVGDYLLVEQYEQGDLQDGHGGKAIHISIDGFETTKLYKTVIHEHENLSATPGTTPENRVYTVEKSDLPTAGTAVENSPWKLKSENDNVITNHKKYGFVNLHKVAGDYDENGDSIVEKDTKLAGATFGIYKGENITDDAVPYLTLKTNKDGEFSRTDDGAYQDIKTPNAAPKHLFYGTYTIKELEAPKGYTVDSQNIVFTISDNTTGHGGTAWIENSDKMVHYQNSGDLIPESYFSNRIKRGTLKLNKVSSENHAEQLSGAEFKVCSENREPVARLLQNTDGSYGLTNQKKDGGSYAEKRDGISYLKQIDGEWKLLNGFYYIQEYQAPSGYKLSDSFLRVEVKEEEEKNQTVENVPISISIEKISEENVDLYNAEYELSGSFSDNTDKKSGIKAKTAIPNLKSGERYTLKETKAPNGYIRYSGEISFSVVKDETVMELENLDETSGESGLVEIAEDKMTLVMKNKPIELGIQKLSSEAEPLSGAEFSITGKFADGVGELTDEPPIEEISGDSAENGSAVLCEKLKAKLVAGQEYEVKETKAPMGYKAASFEFTVNEDGTVTVNNVENGSVTYDKEDKILKVTDKPLALTIRKTDDDGKAIAGTEFSLEELNAVPLQAGKREAEAPLTTDENGEIHLGEKLQINTLYVLKEQKAAEGYVTPEEENAFVEFSLNDAGELAVWDNPLNAVVDNKTTLKITNARAKAEVTIQKKGSDKKDELLDGAEFSISRKDKQGEPVWTGPATGGEVTIADTLECGLTYILSETKAPNGYAKAKDIEFTLAKDGNIESLQIDGKEVPADEIVDNTIVVVDKRLSGGGGGGGATEISFTKVGTLHESCSDTDLGAADPAETANLDGVIFEVYNEENPNTPVAELESEDGIVALDLPDGSYLIKEKASLEGYRLDNKTYRLDIKDRKTAGLYDESGDYLPENTLVNDLYRADICIKKVNEQKKDEVLPGSEYGLFKEVTASNLLREAQSEDTMQLIAKAVTDAEGRLIFKGVLMNTKYMIRELQAPDGSYVSEKPIHISFSVDENGEVKITEFDDGSGTAYVDPETREIVWLEPSVEVEFSKTDEEGNLLAGAKLQVQDSEGTIIEEWTSTQNSYLSSRQLSIGETYKLVEIQAPKGYEIAEPIEFSIDDEPVGPGENKRIQITMVDKVKEEEPEDPDKPVEPENPDDPDNPGGGNNGGNGSGGGNSNGGGNNNGGSNQPGGGNGTNPGGGNSTTPGGGNTTTPGGGNNTNNTNNNNGSGSGTKKPGTSDSSQVKTGDTNTPYLYAILLMLSLNTIGILAVVEGVCRKRRRRKAQK